MLSTDEKRLGLPLLNWVILTGILDFGKIKLLSRFFCCFLVVWWFVYSFLYFWLRETSHDKRTELDVADGSIFDSSCRLLLIFRTCFSEEVDYSLCSCRICFLCRAVVVTVTKGMFSRFDWEARQYIWPPVIRLNYTLWLEAYKHFFWLLTTWMKRKGSEELLLLYMLANTTVFHNSCPE